MGTDALFENHTIKEIQEIERKLRNDIERKKEELRQMVGERYRDLMEAADTITEMKEIAESVTNCVKSVEHGCTALQNSNLQNGILFSIQEDVTKKKKTKELLYIVASQMKILMDSPTKIWFSIENKDFVSALSLYLLARHTHSLLILDPVYREQNVATCFPIINRQWTSISHFKHVLLQSCENALKNSSSEPEDILGLLCCNFFLSNTSLEEIFLSLLQIRKNVLKDIFHPQKSAKAQICEFVSIVQMTLKIVHVLLYPGENNFNNGHETNRLYLKLKEIVSKNKPGPVSLLDLNSTATYKFLPDVITDFRPSSTVDLKPCTVELLKTKCKEWLNDLKEYFQIELKSLLNFVNSVQSLALIREAVFDEICEIEAWDQICTDLLEQQFSIWNCFLKDSIWHRIQMIINEQVVAASEMCQKDTEEALYKVGVDSQCSELEMERNISLYVWVESPADVMENIAWHPRHHRNFWNSGELSMKAMGFTPKIQSICRDLDFRLQNILADISHFSFLQSQVDNLEEKKKLSSVFQKIHLELSKDAGHVYKLLSEAVEKHIFDLSNYLETTLLYLEKENDSYEKNCRIVLLGHLCFGLSHLCPHINCALSDDKLGECVERCTRQKTKVTFSATTMKEHDLWKDLKRKLMELSSSAFRLWSKSEIKNILSAINKDLMFGSAEGLLKSFLRWDKIEIQEESEQGNAVKSVLRIPQHVSTSISNALFSFCCKLNAVGGYSMNSDVRSSIGRELLVGLLDLYREKTSSVSADFNSRLLQVQSLQVLFDVQVLVGLLGQKGDAGEGARSQDILNATVARIDPFDMDVFSVPLQQNVKKALQKSLSLFGLLTSPDQMSYLNSLKSQPLSTQMDHNVMLTCHTGSRFPLLPLSTKSSALAPRPAPEQFSIQQKTPDPKSLPSHSSSPNLCASDTATNPMKSAASFYDKFSAMSSSWFGN